MQQVCGSHYHLNNGNKMDHIKSDKIIITVWFLLLSCFLYQTLNLSVIKYYSIDEFQYSHAAWLFSKGAFPYKDFFEHHFPFSYQLLSIPFLFLDDNPNNIIFLRILMLPFVAIILLSSYLVNSKHGFLVSIDNVKYLSLFEVARQCTFEIKTSVSQT